MGARWGDIQRRGISLSRVEERKGWLGRRPLHDPQNDPRENWAEDPTPAEQHQLERDERRAA